MTAPDAAALLLKAAMAAVFALWFRRSIPGGGRGGSAAEKESSAGSAGRVLLFSFSMFAALGAVYFFDTRPATRANALFYPVVLAMTLVMECSMAAFMGYRTRRELASVALCSLATHPTLHLLAFLPEILFGQDLFYDNWVYYLEAVIVVAESALLNRLLPERRADNPKLALAMNAFSFFGGTAIFTALFYLLSL